MSLLCLREELMHNREVELVLNGHMYYIEPHSRANYTTEYKVWDPETHICLFDGYLDELIKFQFPTGECMENAFDSFEVMYIY